MKHIMSIDETGLKTLEAFEGCILNPYLCSAGVATIGIGTTRYPNGTRVSLEDKPITLAQARIYLMNDLAFFESGVDALTPDSLMQNQFNALVCFAYNVGLQALKGSTLLKKVNRNTNDLTIVEEFTKWIHAGGKTVRGLLVRRNKEASLYFR